MSIPCPGCGQRVSDRASACPFCASALPDPARPAAGHATDAGARHARGDRIGPYRVLDRVGEGGLGVVYRVEDERTGAVHALKAIRGEWLPSEPARARFRKEAETWIALGRHPYLVPALAVEEIEGRLYLATEYVAAPPRGLNSVEEWLARRTPTAREALRAAGQLCPRVEHPHARGLPAPRDLTPANILLGPDRAVRVTDLGIAAAVTPGTPALVRGDAGNAAAPASGSLFGTPTHMAPEQFADPASGDERSDVYAFGVVLYQMAAGGLPFRARVAPGPGASARLFAELRRMHEQSPVPPVESPLFPIAERCLEKNPDARYPTFRALREDLEPLLRLETGEAVAVPAPREAEAAELCNRGLGLVSLGRGEEGLAVYERALALLPGEAVLHSSKGHVLSRLERHEEALQSLAEAIRLDPRHDEAWANRGHVLTRLGRDVEALQAFDQAAVLNPRNPDAWTGRGAALARLGRPEDALESYEQALAIDRRDALAWSLKGGHLLAA